MNFELDSYWPTEAGVNALELMRKLDTRMKLYHINDRGTRLSKPAMTPILKSDSMELGYGNMNLFSLITQAQKVNVDAVILEGMTAIAKENGIDGVVLESHKNWVDDSPLKSMELSAEFMNQYVC